MTYQEIKSLVVVLALITSGGFFSFQIYKLLWVNLKRGQPTPPFTNWAERIKGLFVYVAGQLRLFRFLTPGISHFLIFWGFITLSFTILVAIIEGVVAFRNPEFIFPGLGTFGPLAMLQDFFAVLVALAVLYALYVRLVVNPERYKGSHKRQGVVVLLFILTIMLSLLVMNGIRGNLGKDPIAEWRPVSTLVGALFTRISPNAQFMIEEISYWIHLLVVFVFLTELPGGKHFHVVTSLPAVLLRNLDPRGKLAPAPEVGGEIGVKTVEMFTWRQMFDLYTCTECGRCQEVCPAYNSGLALSPKKLVMDLRDNLIERGAALAANGNGLGEKPILKKALIGEILSEEEIWACTTCFACDQECPLFVEHIPLIADLRRSMVVEGQIDNELQEALGNLGRYGNSFGQSPRTRAKWSADLPQKVTDARRQKVDYLWFVGDFAAYSPTLTSITQQTAEVFNKAGIDFGILYDAEQNAGNDVRRIGEEGLFEMLVEKNSRTLERVDCKAIVTTDPHSYNTLKNEYPIFMDNGIEVLHYSELLEQLIQQGKLRFNRQLGYSVTYHDACFLGRYNNIYDPPRNVIRATGCHLEEMPRTKDRALCCGAGGGRIWMAEGEVTERPSESRIREAVGLNGVKAMVVACPKDITMYLDAVKTTGYEDQLAIKDLIELVAEAIGY
jgi:Fe-S oxidoreductase